MAKKEIRTCDVCGGTITAKFAQVTLGVTIINDPIKGGGVRGKMENDQDICSDECYNSFTTGNAPVSGTLLAEAIG